MAIDEDEPQHDRGFYSEYTRKLEEQEAREKEYTYRDREHKIEKEKLFLTKREMEMAMQLREKDVEVKLKVIEVAEMAAQAKHDLRLAEIAQKLIDVQKEGIAQRQDLLDMENKVTPNKKW